MAEECWEHAEDEHGGGDGHGEEERAGAAEEPLEDDDHETGEEERGAAEEEEGAGEIGDVERAGAVGIGAGEREEEDRIGRVRETGETAFGFDAGDEAREGCEGEEPGDHGGGEPDDAGGGVGAVAAVGFHFLAPRAGDVTEAWDEPEAPCVADLGSAGGLGGADFALHAAEEERAEREDG